MYETTSRLMGFYGKNSKLIIWAHNAHWRCPLYRHETGGLINIGQLVKENHEKEGVVRVGFGSYEGTVLPDPIVAEK